MRWNTRSLWSVYIFRAMSIIKILETRNLLNEENLVTVVVLTFRRFDNLENNINSILSQSYRNIEVIISDDGSENFDELKIKSLFSENKNMKFQIIHSKKNFGTVKNFNNAIDCSNGEYIIPLSQDDCFANTKVVENIVSYFESHDCNYLTAKRKGIKSGKILPIDDDCKLLKGNEKQLIERLLIANFISGACLYYRKESLVKSGMFDTDFKLLEDYPFVLKTVLNGLKIEFLDEVTIKYGESGVTNSKKMSDVLIKDAANVAQKYALPNLSMIRSKLGKRYLMRNYDMLMSNTKLKKIMIAVKYLDITLLLKYYIKVRKKNLDYICHKFFLVQNE